ncbi:MAG: NAD(P)/FAD-dependent oxidoreductase [Proteobacteria bacterium]|nr:NAD(P)/FAD-dependent oxidoreductase [Pseudomonadota bacterium]
MSERNKQDYDIVVIGGGAAGLMCALTAGQRGRRVLIIESSNKIGKKILMSGGGRCNFTNLLVETDNYLSANPHFCKSALSRYSQWDFISLVEKHRIPYHERKHGQLFCNESSKHILNMLLVECREANVEIKTQCHVDSVTQATPGKSGFEIRCAAETYESQSLVVATGALSIPKMGATGFAFKLAEQFGIKVLRTRAGLVPFVFDGPIGSMCERLAGVSIESELQVAPEHSRFQKSFREQLLFTHRGLSGPVALQLSSYWSESTPIELDLFPDLDVGSWFIKAKTQRPNILLRTLISEILPKTLTLELENLCWSNNAETGLSNWSNDALKSIASRLKRWPILPAGTEGYRTAEVTVGGVDTEELSSKTMQSKRHPGLYFIGEAVDVTGHLGGFNFQWAWASGHAAGRDA